MDCLKGILIRKLAKENESEVLDLITKYYASELFRDMFDLEGEDVIKCHQIRTKMKLKQDSSLGAFLKESNQLVGVVFGRIKEKRNLERIDFLQEGLNISLDLQACHKFFSELEDEAFDLLRTDRFFSPAMICVHKDYRGKGISSALLQALNDLALQSGCRYLVSTVTSEIRIQVYLRAGNIVLKEVKYHDHHDQKIYSTILKNAKYPYLRAQIVYRKLT